MFNRHRQFPRRSRCLRQFAIAGLLCCLAIVCTTEKDTDRGKEWRGLYLSKDVGAIKGAPDESCPETIASHDEALGILMGWPQCTESVIDTLETLGAKPDVLNDLAAAYYTRGVRESRETDLLPAYDDAFRAHEEDPRYDANLELIEEKLGLHTGGNPAVSSLTSELEGFEKNVLAGDDVEVAQRKAADLSRRLRGDRYVLDAVAAMKRAHKGHVAFRDEMPNAAQLLKSEGSPVWIAAQLDYVRTEWDKSLSMMMPMVDEAGAYARQHRYEHTTARIEGTRGWLLQRAGRYGEALSSHITALKTFEQFHDYELEASTHRNLAGLYRELGMLDSSWSEALKAARLLPHVRSARRKNSIYGEIATTAVALAFPEPALQYETAAIRMLQQHPFMTPQDRSYNLAAMYRARAQTELKLKRDDQANEDLRLASALVPDESAKVAQNAVPARIHEARGQAIRSDPKAAIAEFTAAIAALHRDELTTFHAELLLERADAKYAVGLDGDADVEEALRDLHKEERRMLERRNPGEDEDIWSPYFSRFEEAYARLVRHRMKTKPAEAFNDKERSLAIEPLDLILKNGVAPPEFARLVPNGEPMRLDAIRPLLPEGTFLLEYAVLDDLTYVWIVSRDDAVAVQSTANREDVERWIGELQRAARYGDNVAFERTTKAAFDGLLRQPLANIARRRNGRELRLAIVPDRIMLGLPFAALYDSVSRRYLVEQAPIELAPSATLYVYSLLRDRQLPFDAPPTALIVGDPRFDDQLDLTRGMKPLRYAADEAREIGPIYGPDAVVLTGEQATPRRFLQDARDKTIVHIAAHSIVNEREPSHSVLLLAKSGSDAGLIDAEQLVKNLKLDRTRLVVLSSCSSAGGHPVGLEGVAPLVRPLITAGVPAVLGSLWDVDDATTKELSVSFHRHYGKNGADAAMALQHAQLEMLQRGNRGLRSVLAWAPFQVIGHGSSPIRVAE